MNNRFKEWKYPKLRKVWFVKCWKSKYGWRVWHNKDNFILGHATDIGDGCRFFCHEKVIIEDFVEIGGDTYIYTYNSINNIKGEVIIKKKAKIGAKCLILPGVIVEEGEMIPAMSLVFVNKKDERVIR